MVFIADTVKIRCCSVQGLAGQPLGPGGCMLPQVHGAPEYHSSMTAEMQFLCPSYEALVIFPRPLG